VCGRYGCIIITTAITITITITIAAAAAATAAAADDFVCIFLPC